MASTSRRIDYVPLDQITGTESNPRAHDLPGVIKSIAVLGFTSPSVLDERTGRLIIGNGRLAALRVIRAYVNGDKIPDKHAHVFKEARVARALTGADGQRRAPDGIRVEADGTWAAPLVRGWHSHDDEHARAAVIADNRLTELAEWDEVTLAEWLDEILDVDTDLLAVTGYTAEDLDDLLADLTRDEPAPSARLDPAPPPGAGAGTAAVVELALTFTQEQHAEAVSLIKMMRDRLGDETAADLVLTALRSYCAQTAT